MLNDLINSADFVYDCGDGVKLYSYSGGREVFDSLCSAALNDGFTLDYRSDIDGNVTACFKGMSLLVISCLPSENRVSLIDDAYSAEPSDSSDFENRGLSCFYLFETDHSLIDCGMCLILRLCDGSFFIVDSAHFLSVHDDIRLHDFLRRLTSDGEKIRISGWFVTHGHDDHINKLTDFLRRRFDDVVVERFYMNLPSDEVISSNRRDECVLNFINDFRRVVAETGIPVVKLHTGQRFKLRNAVFDVMITHEDNCFGSFADFNDTSTVLMCSIEGQKILIPGDAAVEANANLLRRYRDALKCDILQVSHHGHTGLSSELYKLCGAATALFPVTYIKFLEELPRQEANKTVIEIADEYFISSDGTVALPLPYRPGVAERYNDETFENFGGIYNLWQYEYSDDFKADLIRRRAENGFFTPLLP